MVLERCDDSYVVTSPMYANLITQVENEAELQAMVQDALDCILEDDDDDEYDDFDYYSSVPFDGPVKWAADYEEDGNV